MVGLIESYARQLDIAPNPALTAGAGRQRALGQRGHADRALDRRRHRLLHAQRRRPGQQLRHAQRQPDPRHRALPEHQGLGRHLRLRPGERLRDAEGGARRPHPARGHDRQPRPGSTCCRHHGHRAAVTGRVAAPRATSYDYRVEWAPGLQPPLYPATDHWTDRRPPDRADRAGVGHAGHPRPGRRSPPPCPTTARARPSTRPCRTGPTRSVLGAAPGGGHRARRRRGRARRARCRSRCSSTTTPTWWPACR